MRSTLDVHGKAFFSSSKLALCGRFLLSFLFGRSVMQFNWLEKTSHESTHPTLVRSCLSPWIIFLCNSYAVLIQMNLSISRDINNFCASDFLIFFSVSITFIKIHRVMSKTVSLKKCWDFKKQIEIRLKFLRLCNLLSITTVRKRNLQNCK